MRKTILIVGVVATVLVLAIAFGPEALAKYCLDGWHARPICRWLS